MDNRLRRRLAIGKLFVSFWTAAYVLFVCLPLRAEAVESEAELTTIFGSRHFLNQFIGDQTQAVVVVVMDDKCPVVQKSVPDVLELYRRYNSFAKDRAGRPASGQKHRGDRVRFLGVYVKPGLGAKEMADHAAKMRIPFRVVHDAEQKLIEELKLTRLSEIAILDRDQQLLYRGPVNDRHSQGADKPAATKHYVADVLEQLLAGKPVKPSRQPAVGCKITPPPARSASDLTFHRDVAPIVQRSCAGCHRPGEVAPMSLQTIEEVNAYAEMVAEVVRDGRMPPYPAVSTREFAHDERLTDDERRILLEWLQSEREAGELADAPPAVVYPDRRHWQIGEPDFVFRMPKPFEVPATGVLDYVYVPIAVNGGKGFDEDRWIEAIETHPGAPQVVHHVQIHEYFGPVDRDPTALDQILIYGLGVESARLLGSYTPGNEEGNKLVFSRYLDEASAAAGKTAGIKLSKGANLMFEVHYTTNGTAMADQSEVAIKFAKRKPDVELETWFPFRSRPDMIIPANVENHSLQDLYHFGRVSGGRPVLLHGIRPHMHSRGKSFRVELVSPQGLSPAVVRDFAQHDKVRGETILSIPVWDFSWQRFYQFKEPILITPQQALLATAYWDNTEFNPRNPDPQADVPWGQQTIQEMFNTLLLYEVLDPNDPRGRPAEQRAVAETGG